MKLQHICRVGALILAAAVTGATAQQAINSGQMATSLAGVSDTRLSLTGAQMRQAVLDNIRNYPGALPPRPLTFPQLENLAQFIVEVDFDFNSAVIKPSSYRTIGAIADALHNPILLGYGFLVIGHTDFGRRPSIQCRLESAACRSDPRCLDRSIQRQSGCA